MPTTTRPWSPSTPLASAADHREDLVSARAELDRVSAAHSARVKEIELLSVGDPTEGAVEAEIKVLAAQHARLTTQIQQLQAGAERAEVAEAEAIQTASATASRDALTELNALMREIDPLQEQLAERFARMETCQREFRTRWVQEREADIITGLVEPPMLRDDDFLAPGRVRLTAIRTGRTLWPV